MNSSGCAHTSASTTATEGRTSPDDPLRMQRFRKAPEAIPSTYTCPGTAEGRWCYAPDMPGDVPVDLGEIEETSLITVWARAEETRKPHALFRDLRAVRIVDSLDYDFDRFDGAWASQVGTCVRARAVDGRVARFMDAHPGATVVELGPGLDGRFERLDDGRVRWIEVDLPDAMALRQRFFPASPRCTQLVGDLLGAGWTDEVLAHVGDGPVLFVAEGVFPYFDAAQIRAVLGQIARAFPGALVGFDVMSSFMIRYQAWHDSLRHVKAEFQWGTDDLAEIEGWGEGWVAEEATPVLARAVLHEERERVPARFRALARLSVAWPWLRHHYRFVWLRLGR